MNYMAVKQEEGSVMLETILVLPVYFILIAVTFYVGEISLYRNLLLELDGYDTQRTGNRNAAAAEEREKIISFLFQIPDGTSRKWSGFEYEGVERRQEESSNQWWQRTEVCNQGALILPEWIKGIRYLTRPKGSETGPVRDGGKYIFYGSTGRNGTVRSVPFYSRKDTNRWRGGQYADGGAGLCVDENPLWAVIAGENYCGSSGRACYGKELSEYLRTGFDRTGSGASPYQIFSGE